MGTQLLEDYSKTSYMGSRRLFDIDFNITSKKITKTNLFNIFFLISNYLVYETTIQHVFPIHSDRERNQYIILNDQYIHTYVTLYMIIPPSMRKSTVWFQLNWHIFHIEISAYQTIRFFVSEKTIWWLQEKNIDQSWSFQSVVPIIECILMPLLFFVSCYLLHSFVMIL